MVHRILLRAESWLLLRSQLLCSSTRGLCVASSTGGRNDACSREYRGIGKRKSVRNAVLRCNRHNPELERLTRLRRLRIPLDEVRQEWSEGRGSAHLQAAGQHFHLYQDVYGGSVFWPLGLMEVKYPVRGMEVHRGNVIYPAQAAVPPEVVLPQLSSTKSDLWTLVLCNPDGNPKDGSKEILHWLVCNIPSSGVLTDGETAMPYLPPLPFRGSGVHRMVFTLYRHMQLLPFSCSRSPSSTSGGSWIDQRTFCSQNFVSTHSLVPFTFSFYQTLWDDSVSYIFSETLASPEFVYDLESQPTPRQLKQAQIKHARSQRYRSL